MRAIWSTLLVYGIAFVAVFGLQLLAVDRAPDLADRRPRPRAGRARRAAGRGARVLADPHRHRARSPRAGPGAPRLRLVPSGVPAREILVMVVGILALSQALESLVLLLGVGTRPRARVDDPHHGLHHAARARARGRASSACSRRSARSCSSGATC